jgi:glyoxylase-like metal-dependent hydrolase (beta-lactamase superfamily II)
MIFRQLFEPSSSTYSYLLACPRTGECAIIDPVVDTAERDLEVLQGLGLTLTYTIDTHVHADHLTGALKLKHMVASRICFPALDELPCVDIGLREGETFRIGDIELLPLFTPGHTDTHHCYLIDNGTQNMLFSGDALDYDGRFVSTIAQEKTRNPRLKDNKSLEDFVAIMDSLDLPYPKKIDFAVPGNRMCGKCPPNVPEVLRAPCDFHDQG